jgi:chemotaxis protein CheC
MSLAEEKFDDRLISFLGIIAREGAQNAAKGFSGMVGCNLTVQNPSVNLVPLNQIPEMLGGPENEAVGIYLRAEGDLAGQIMLVLPCEKAYKLVDLMMGLEPGTTDHLGSIERSALAEVGNITGSFFLNSVAALTGVNSRPSPPAVMVDMIGAILDIIIATGGGLSEHVLMLRASFEIRDQVSDVDFWVIPDPKTLGVFSQRAE